MREKLSEQAGQVTWMGGMGSNVVGHHFADAELPHPLPPNRASPFIAANRGEGNGRFTKPWLAESRS